MIIRCCEGETYVLPNAPRYDDTGLGVMSKAAFGHGLGEVPTQKSWAVMCFDCDACLAVVDGVERDEVYACL